MKHLVRFGEWIWNPHNLELRRGAYVATLEPRVAQLFEFMFAHQRELLSHDYIAQHVWEGRIVSDEAVRRAVFILRQAFSADGADTYISTVRKKGYIAEFPHTVAAPTQSGDANLDVSNLSTALDNYTPVQPTIFKPAPVASTEVGAAHIPTSPRMRTLLLIAGAVILVAAVAPWLEAVREREPAVTQTKAQIQTPVSLAVLPFINLNEEPDTEFLADGLAEELLGTLARYQDLRVTARSSAFQFKGRDQDVREVGQRLGVRYVLEGTVRKSAEQVRINVRLIDAASDTQLWAETYDRTLEDWFALQQNVAEEVGSALVSVLPRDDNTNPKPAETNNMEAHLELLRARQLLSSRSVSDAEQAIEHLQRALTLDPNYALAYARLADAMLIQAESTSGIKSARPTVAPLLDKAIELDPGLGEAYALRSLLTDKPADAERKLRKGLELNPSYARGYELLASLQARNLSKLELARHTIDRAIALDPLSPGNYDTKATLLMQEGDWAGAVALYHRALDLNPDFRSAIVGLGVVSALEGHFADAILYTERAVALDPQADSLRGQLVQWYAVLGDLDAVRSINDPPTEFDRQVLFLLQGDSKAAVDAIYNWTPSQAANFPSQFLSQIVLRQALTDGNYERALNYLSTAYHIGDSLPSNAFAWQLYAYANQVQLLTAIGDSAAASKLQEQIETRMIAIESQFPRHAKLYNHVRAVLLAYSGLTEEACAAFERGTTPNPGPGWWIYASNPAFDGMHDTLCFQALLARFKAHTAAERDHLEAMRRAGEIPDRSSANSVPGVDATDA